MVMWAICCLCDDELVNLKFEFCLVRVGDCGAAIGRLLVLVVFDWRVWFGFGLGCC